MAQITKANGLLLNLTIEEAYALWKILANVGGNPLGPRGELDHIFVALCDKQYLFKDLDEVTCYNPDNVNGHAALYIDRIENKPKE